MHWSAGLYLLDQAHNSFPFWSKGSYSKVFFSCWQTLQDLFQGKTLKKVLFRESSTTTTQKDDLKLGPSHHRSFHALFHFNEKIKRVAHLFLHSRQKMYPDLNLKGTFKISFLQSSKKVIFMPMFFKKNFAFLHKYRKVLMQYRLQKRRNWLLVSKSTKLLKKLL